MACTHAAPRRRSAALSLTSLVKFHCYIRGRKNLLLAGICLHMLRSNSVFNPMDVSVEEAEDVRARGRRPIGWQLCHRPQWLTPADPNAGASKWFEHNPRTRTHGLSRAEYDQKEGRVLGWHEQSARFMVQLDGVAEPMRLRPENLLCCVHKGAFSGYDPGEANKPEWRLASREVVVSWEQPSLGPCEAAASLKSRAARALLAAGASAGDLRAAGVPADLVAIVDLESRRGQLSVTVPAEYWLAEEESCHCSLYILLFEDDEQLEHAAFEQDWRLEQSSAHGARWVLPVAPYDETQYNGHAFGGPKVAELMPYYELLKAVSQRVARYNDGLARGDMLNSDIYRDGHDERWRVVANPPLCILPADDDCHGYHAHGHLRFGFPLFYGGKTDVGAQGVGPHPAAAAEASLRAGLAPSDGHCEQLLRVLREVDFPPELCRRRWKVRPLCRARACVHAVLDEKVQPTPRRNTAGQGSRVPLLNEAQEQRFFLRRWHSARRGAEHLIVRRSRL